MSRRNRSRRFANAGAPPGPWQLSNLGIWLDPAIGYSLNGSPPVANLSAWADQSGNGYHLSEGTAINQGVWHQNGGINDLPYVTMAANTLYAIANSFPQTTDSMFWFAFASTALLGSGQRLMLDRGGLGQELYMGNAADGRTPAIRWSGADRLVYASAVTTLHVIRMRLTVSGTLGIRIDNGVEQTNAAGQTQISTWANMGHTSAGPLGDLYGVVSQKSIATAAEDAMMQTYWQRKLGLW